MKSILISIQPQWVEKILNKEKTIEIRKTKPSCELPVKVYIYETKGKKHFYNYIEACECPSEEERIKFWEYGSGKVVAEFTLNEVEDFYVFENGSVQGWNCFGLNRSCLTYEQIAEYIGLDKKGYAWHIDDLVVYDKPKELSEFSGFIPNNKCEKHENGFACDKCDAYDKEHDTCLALYYCRKPIKRPPQSYMFVEDLGDDYE